MSCFILVRVSVDAIRWVKARNRPESTTEQENRINWPLFEWSWLIIWMVMTYLKYNKNKLENVLLIVRVSYIYFTSSLNFEWLNYKIKSAIGIIC